MLQRLGLVAVLALIPLVGGIALATPPGEAPVREKIHDGQWLNPTDWPASLQAADCSATLIGPRVVLTAAHCVTQEMSRDLRDRLDLEVKAKERAGRSKTAPDLALLLLEEDAPIEPAERLETCPLREPGPGQRVYVTGCGYHQENGPALRGAWAWVIEAADEQGSCTRIHLEDAAVIPGDSGGGVYDSAGPQRRLVGVVVSTGPGRSEACFESVLSAEAQAFFERFESDPKREGARICGRDCSLASDLCR